MDRSPYYGDKIQLKRDCTGPWGADYVFTITDITDTTMTLVFGKNNSNQWVVPCKRHGAFEQIPPSSGDRVYVTKNGVLMTEVVKSVRAQTVFFESGNTASFFFFMTRYRYEMPRGSETIPYDEPSIDISPTPVYISRIDNVELRPERWFTVTFL